ncbi:pseudaminic acid cytidylyltransferase [Oceanospirillaceae bacterium]|nr:pseudaminic acid cytidylyltransferase [Oceanospirillaceae bacterium]
MNIAIIPARGGSKRIPRKNIKNFHGKPLIAYSIEAALNSKVFDRVIVSTDDSEIAEVAKKYGAEVPFMRPEDISNDYATTMDVIKHALSWFTENHQSVAYACCIYATAPFISSEALIRGLSALVEGDFNYAFSATSFPFPIQRALMLSQDGSTEMFMPEHLNTRSQDLDQAYHDAGQFYWGKTTAFLNKEPIFSNASYAVILPRNTVQDIDTLEDWSNAESMYEVLTKSKL